MTHPAQQQRPVKTLTTPMIAAIAAVAMLALVTAIVVLSRDDDAAGAATLTTSASSATEPSPGSPGSPTTVTSDTYGVSYTYEADGYDESRWAGPESATVGIVDLESATSYEACLPTAGTDLIYALTSSTDSDLATAARLAAVDMSKSVWSGEGEATVTDPTPAAEKQTDGGITGELVEIETTRPTGPDDCGTTTIHVASYAFEAADGTTVVMLASYRTDGELPKDVGAIEDDVAATLRSLTLA